MTEPTKIPTAKTEEQALALLNAIPDAFYYVLNRESRRRSKEVDLDTKAERFLQQCPHCLDYFRAREIRKHRPLCPKNPVGKAKCRFCGLRGGVLGMSKHERKCDRNPDRVTD